MTVLRSCPALLGGWADGDLRHLNPLLHSRGPWTPRGSSLASQLQHGPGVLVMLSGLGGHAVIVRSGAGRMNARIAEPHVGNPGPDIILVAIEPTDATWRS